jgi:hypothetical protein
MPRIRCLFVALAALTTLVVLENPAANARPLRSTDAQRVGLSRIVTPEPVEAAPDASCCPKPCITYRHCGPKLCCGPCKPPKSIVLTVKDPCTCCETEVTVCMPACCEGEPTVCAGKGFLCRDIVEYEWCCGYSVRVAFKKCGDLVVTTWGR